MRVRRHPWKRPRTPRPVGRAPLEHPVDWADARARAAAIREAEAEKRRARARRAGERIDALLSGLPASEWGHYA